MFVSRDDHKHSDVDSDAETEPLDAVDMPDTSLLPDSYKTWPHLFLYVPRKARELWVQTCSQLLGEVHVAGPRRALVTVLDEPAAVPGETALLAEAALAVDWSRPEEDHHRGRNETSENVRYFDCIS